MLVLVFIVIEVNATYSRTLSKLFENKFHGCTTVHGENRKGTGVSEEYMNLHPYLSSNPGCVEPVNPVF